MYFHDTELSSPDEEPQAHPFQEKLNEYFVYAGIGWQMAGGEIIARVAEQLQGSERPRLQRMGYEAVTCPTTKNLEDLFYPNPQKIAAAAYSMVHDNGSSWAPRQVDSPEVVQFRGPF